MPDITLPPGAQTPSQTVTFSIPSIRDEATALDLANAIVPISGVARVDTDTRRHTVTVEFDIDYLDATNLRTMIGKIGYPVEEQ